MPNKAVWKRYKKQQLVAAITQPNQSGILKQGWFSVELTFGCIGPALNP